MKRQGNVVFGLLISILVVSCASPTLAPSESMIEPDSSIETGDALGKMVFVIAKDESGEPSIFNSCSPFVSDSDPAVMVRTCSVPQIPYLFIGYGDLETSLEELDSVWENEAWELYFDGNAVDLTAFGYFDIDLGEFKLRSWKIALENLTPGEHKLRYVISKLDKSAETLDVTWVFTVEANTTLPTQSSETMTYPTLSSTIVAGQNPYTSEKAKLNFLLYLPDKYGKDTQLKWPLILYLHGLLQRGNNLDYLISDGLPRKLHNETEFPAIVVSPQGNGEYEFWSEDAMVNSLFLLLDEIQTKYSVDPDRIYLTGVSAGGEGTWEIGLRYPNRFAALVPVMGYYGYPFEVPANICDLKDVPIWAFHGDNDELIPLDAE
ncbi:MAG TPA: PHB depolymerase family esterase, partial [Anaerolineales bacterium]|nr:PHB depolymerase family esterase [Anaerolineales bacterium]